MKTLMTTLVAVLALSLSSWGYAKDCKGQSQSACGKSSSCKWVDGYKRKDGKQVKGYCRASTGKAKSKLSATAKDTKKSASKKSEAAVSKAKSKAKSKSKSKAELAKAKAEAKKKSKSKAKKKAKDLAKAAKSSSN